MTKRLLGPPILIATILWSCSKSEITVPPENADTNLSNTTAIDGSVMKLMEGIYKLSDGSDGLGKQFVCKVSKYKVSFFSEKEGIFMILKYGLSADSSIQFSGFWRFSETPTQGNIAFTLPAGTGGKDLFHGIITNLSMSGFFMDNSNKNPISIQFERHFTPYTAGREFMVFAHHGVQTTSNPPYAENSINGVLNDEDYGVNGLEFDVRMTKDNVPICIHDPGINVRLTQKGPLSGNWDQYGFTLINDYIRLVDGQHVPSVEHVLKVFVDSTTLKYLWMDIKGNKDVFKYLEPIVRNAYARAAQQGRTVTIFAGMPTDDVISEFKAQPTYADLPTLCEESLDRAIANGSQFFGPRFSQGLLLDQVEEAHSHGIRVISWSLNDKGLIKNYIQNGKFDGFITDYPSYVVYNYYTLY